MHFESSLHIPLGCLAFGLRGFVSLAVFYGGWGRAGERLFPAAQLHSSCSCPAFPRCTVLSELPCRSLRALSKHARPSSPACCRSQFCHTGVGPVPTPSPRCRCPRCRHPARAADQGRGAWAVVGADPQRGQGRQRPVGVLGSWGVSSWRPICSQDVPDPSPDPRSLAAPAVGAHPVMLSTWGRAHQPPVAPSVSKLRLHSSGVCGQRCVPGCSLF